MNSAKTIAAAALALGIGFGAGNVLAETAVRMRFERCSLYAAALQLHAEKDLDFLFAQSRSSPVTFEVEERAVTRMAKDVAAAFGKTSTNIGQVFVFDEALPPRATALERLNEANRWLLANLPPSEPSPVAGRSDAFRVYLHEPAVEVRAIAAALGSDADTTFSKMSPPTQQQVVDILRILKWQGAAAEMNQVLVRMGQQ